MKKLLLGLLGNITLLVASTAHAQPLPSSSPSPMTGEAAATAPRTSVDEDARGYCELVSGVAASESALLVAPSIFGSVGVVSGADATGTASSLPPYARVQAGASYSLGALSHGMALRSAAAAECRRYRAESRVRAFIEGNLHGRSATALSAKARTLEAALPRAEDMVKELVLDVAAARATIDDLQAVEMRADAMRTALHDARAELDAAAGTVLPPTGPLERILRERDQAESAAQHREAAVRRAKAWDVSVRGGYDQIFGVSSHTPVFGMATLTVNVGALFQGGAERRAEEGRSAWVRGQVEGTDERASLSLQRLRALRSSERARLAEVETLDKELEERAHTMESMTGERAKAYSRTLWFDQVRVRAERAYLVAHVRELDAALAGGAS